jgi:uncharacterized repeat protein (TIGR03803 family)
MKLGPAPTCGALMLALFSALALIASVSAHAQTESVLYNFCSQVNCTDGSYPESRLTADSAGNLYGTSNAGGAATGSGFGLGGGTVFQLSPDGTGGWKETVLYSFCSAPNCTDGFFPNYSGVVFDSSGNLYGTTSYGGANASGVVFELSPAAAGWKETVLYNFCSQSSCTDGNYPAVGVILDPAGNLYGSTTQNGDTSTVGIIFKLTPSGSEWTEQLIYDAGSGWAGLTMDASGDIFCVTELGTAVELSPSLNGDWVSTVIHTFTGGVSDGVAPLGTPVLDKAGDVYGTTQGGGAFGYGTVYELSPAKNGKWTSKLLHSFQGGEDGKYPTQGLVFDPAGDLFGTTSEGGSSNINTYGTVFELLAPSGQIGFEEKILSVFDNANGAYPGTGSLLLDNAGNIYGTAPQGGLHGGTGVAFKVSPPPPAPLVSNLNPSIYGEFVTWTATIPSSGSIPPTGKVNFTWNGYSIGTATLSAGGVATLTRSLNADAYPLTAVYKGDANNKAYTSPVLNQVVQQATSLASITSSANPSSVGQPVTFTAKFTSPTVLPSGPVTFMAGTKWLGTVQLGGGKATLTTSSLSPGSIAVTVTFSGDSNIATSSASVTQTVD